MEIVVNIPQNTYSVPTEIRPEVVQLICEAFLRGTCNSTFHPSGTSVYRRATHFVELRDGHGIGFISPADYPSMKDYVRFHGCEMAAAFKALRKAGYHIFKLYVYGSWVGYHTSEKPYYDGGTEVTEFTDFID